MVPSRTLNVRPKLRNCPFSRWYSLSARGSSSSPDPSVVQLDGAVSHHPQPPLRSPASTPVPGRTSAPLHEAAISYRAVARVVALPNATAGSRARGCTSLFLVRRVATGTTPIAAAVAAPGEPPAEASPAAKPTAAATTAHAGDVGPLGRHLDVAALEDTLVEHQRLGDQAGLCELDVGVAVAESVAISTVCPIAFVARSDGRTLTLWAGQ